MEEKIIEMYHNRGNDGVANIYLKGFGTEKIPSKRFIPNAAFYLFPYLLITLSL
jgi:hypothetical protein